MQVIFIHHSCFVVEIDERVLIFDYFGGDRVNGYQFTGRIPTYEKDTPIYVFASHHHQDHYDMDVLRMKDYYTNIHFIFSKEIRISPNFLAKHGIDPVIREQVTFVVPKKTYEVGDLKITTYNSTDSGVAFYVEVAGVTVFHAGDLNDWSMEGAGDLINGKTRRAYRHEINKLAGKPINVAFVPMDPRLGEYQKEGIEYFLKTTDAEYVFPMHMWQDYSAIPSYKKQISNRQMAERVIEINRENQVFPFGEN